MIEFLAGFAIVIALGIVYGVAKYTLKFIGWIFSKLW